MSQPIEQFLPPLINPSKVIKRPGLMAQITESAMRSILFIHAPAGYGKTTAAAQWIGNKKAAWFSLDEYSSMPANFYRGVPLALSAPIPDDFAGPPWEMMIRALQNLKEWPAVFVIDDFHLLGNSAAAALPLIRSRMPATTAVLILSRNPPPEALSESIIKGTVKQISDLRFSSQEIRLLFDKNGINLSKNEADLLYQGTDGWAAALTAMILSNSNGYMSIIKKETLNQYLRACVFDCWVDFEELKKCSICDILNPELCEAITGRADIWDIITALANKTGLVSRHGNNTYRFHSLLKEFLESELKLDEKIDKPLLYKTAAYWYRENGEWLHTLDMAAKSGDHDAIEEIARAASKKHDSLGLDVTEYIRFVEKTFLSVPLPIIEKYPRLSGHCFMAALLSYPASEACMWADILKKQMEKGLTNPSDAISAAFQRAVDPRHSSWYVPKQFKGIPNVLPKTAKGTNMVAISINFPFFHKAQRDYTDISHELPEYIAEFTDQLEPVAGSIVKVLAALIEAGVLYERGELPKAEVIAERLIKNIDALSPELRFCVYVLYVEILRMQGKRFEPQIIGDMIEDMGAHYLSSNYDAFTTNILLDSGDECAASKWLERQNPIGSVQLYKVYRHLTTAKAMMVTGKLSAAEKLLEEIVQFSLDYRRNADYIEALTLRAICLWRMKRVKEAVEIITDGIIKAKELQLTMPIVKQGADILPVLQKILNRLKYGYDAEILDKAFVNLLFMRARELSKHMPGMSQSKAQPIKLSPRQSEVMGYLVQNLTYQEISEKMGVTTAAVDYHIRILHEKFQVSNTSGLLQKAQEMGLISSLV